MHWLFVVLVACFDSGSCQVVDSKIAFVEDDVADAVRLACSRTRLCREMQPGVFVVWKHVVATKRQLEHLDRTVE